jgi:hypothetical protein
LQIRPAPRAAGGSFSPSRKVLIDDAGHVVEVDVIHSGHLAA